MKHILTLAICLLSMVAYSQSCTYCEGATAPTLTATSSGGVGAVVYTWTSPTATQTTGATAAANEAGTWSWTATDANNCQTSGTFDVIIVLEPTVTISAMDGCAGENQTISAAGVPGGSTYSWNFGTGSVPATATTATASVNWSSGGTKTITLDIVYQGCTFQYTTTVEVSDISGSATCN